MKKLLLLFFFIAEISIAATGWQGSILNTSGINVSGLTPSLPVQTDGSKNLTSAAIDLSGSQVTGVLPLANIALTYPISATVLASSAITLVGNTVIPGFSSSQMFSFLVNQVPTVAANGDSFFVQFYLAAGTYTLVAVGATANNAGITDISVDGNLVFSPDWYSAGVVFNTQLSHSVTVTGNGLHILTATINGKNASSSDFFFHLTAFIFR